MLRHLIEAAVLALVTVAVASTALAQETVIQPGEAARERAEEPSPAAAPSPEPMQAESAPAAAPAAAVPALAEPAPAATPAPPQPAPAAKPASVPAPPPEPPPVDGDERLPSYAARAVVPPLPGQLREEQRIGDYGQPRWTAHRRFPTTRVYVRPPRELAFEWWLEMKQSLEDSDAARYRSQYEFEMGLGHRLQLDLYLQTEQAGHQAPLELKAEKLELRWALADWGVIPLNPTLYVEYVRQHDGPPKLELKGLLGEELAPRWHFGFNVVFEHELGGELENEYALVSGLSYTISDSALSLGVEVKFETVDVGGDRLSFENWELLGGPSLAWTPTPPMHVLLVALLGNETEGDEKTALFEPTLVVGWEI